ncbi:Carbohydrate deacetylase [Pediococcus pentosaceus]|jgi:predicted glycoside hydrolase/deacetylase ChbG (UPF0249 family)|uniref:Chitin disaccharide deacetylase n=2 Tax=Pediococcus pentosaceus TaxID=1255 RepID=A0A1Y0VVI3_PEDPE|nr:ChbG/HpnK family deacetylase [Pediococcus pentosaceus]ARW20683.1 Chitin disaccharide deacetylase [Pediococcus pentosaceus]QHM65262.1 Carbohydrate deacetylase [Pediococcus pentosaceus]QHM66981.1 Carbohydrate deacetylase [Pediococcus pentosaceus]QHM68865.1 Carbohydrate deacetylase [Pediococcus pentosaceus]
MVETKLIIRADDLGYSDAVNIGIERSVHKGIINNVGVMVNMPTTLDGLSMIRDTKVCLGLHVVISSGRPLLNPKFIPSIVDDDGAFLSSADYRKAPNDFVNLDEVILEIEAQYQKFIELVGRKPDYFEGHAVVSDNFFKGLLVVAKCHQLNLLQVTLNSGRPSLLFKGHSLHVFMESMNKDYNPYQTLKRAVLSSCDEEYPMMICHPGYLDDYLLKHSSLTTPRTKEVEMLTDPQVRAWLYQHQVRLIKYNEI